MKKLRLYFLVVCLIFARVSITVIFNFLPKVQVQRIDEVVVLQNNSLHLNFEDEVPLKIVIWLNPRLSKTTKNYRMKFITEKMIVPQNTGNSCFNREYKCEMTFDNDNTTLSEAGAILFIELAHYFKMKDLPPNWKNWRRPDQIWAVQIDESPVYHSSRLLEVFNWTLSYRRDSDIWLPYGRTVAKLEADQEIMMGLNNETPLSKWIDGKSKLVTGAISNCRTNSKREYLVKQIIKTGRSVDIYGGCGNVKNVTKRCGFYGGNCTRFWENLATNYKFYLAFENSICEDYVTEKFWRTLKLGIVPVVYGGADYEKLAPPESYIDVNWFEDAEQLMGYLEEVGGNATKYKMFFEWKRNYDVREEATRYMTAESDIWCQFCRKLRELKTAEKEYVPKMVPSNWWSQGGGLPNSTVKQCTSLGNFLKWGK